MGPIETLARTIWGEARNQSKEGMEAVANVVMNRVRNPRWWGDDVIEVCRKDKQFSCWNKGDPNLPLLLAVTEKDPRYALALDIAKRAVSGELSDGTNGADHYYNPKVVNPRWSDPKKVTKVIGDHVFLRLEAPAPAALKAVVQSNTAFSTGAMTATGVAAVATSTAPAIEALGSLQPVVAVSILLIGAGLILAWRFAKQRGIG